MPRSPLALAALATAAVPGLDARSTRSVPSDGADDVAVVEDGDGNAWTVRAPRDAAAGAALEAEAELLSALGVFETSGALSFAAPRITGTALLPEGGRAMVHPTLDGHPLDLAGLHPGPGLAAELGRVIASIHELPHALVENAGLPAYTADEYRVRHMAEVDEAARTRKVPTRLLRRWEHSLENVSLWRFQPVVVHGDLGPDQILTSGRRIVAVTQWSEAKVADPADDLAWIIASVSPETAESVMEAYQLRRAELRDPHLVERAHLVSELAVARWLLHGVRHGLDAVIVDAVGMLTELDESTRSSAE